MIPTITTYIQYCTEGPDQCNKARKINFQKEIKGIKVRK